MFDIIQPQTLFFDVPTHNDKGTHRIAVYEWGGGNRASKTLFCVHGLTRNGRDFDLLASSLYSFEKGITQGRQGFVSAIMHEPKPDIWENLNQTSIVDSYRVLSVDIAGRGKSQWHNNPAHYNYASYVSDIAYLITKLGLSDIHWLGTSMGGIIGMMIANNFPNLLKTLILNDIGCFIPATGLTRISQYVSSLTNFKTLELAQAELRCRCSQYGIKNEKHWQNLFTHSICETENGSFNLSYDPAIASNLFPAGKPIEDVNLWPLWEAVKKIPTMLIRGMDSDILTHQTAIEMERSHPNFSLLEIENTGHAPALMDAEQINAIKRWLKCN